MPADSPSPGRRVPIGLIAVGSEMASFTIIGVLLDFALGTMPGFTIGLTLAGLAIAFFHLVKMSQALAGKKPEPPKPPESPKSPDSPHSPNGGTS
jgi:F0F1-type ATP synthase assembly protein I